MVFGERKRHDCAPGVADDHRALDAELAQGLVEQLGLLGSGPQMTARALAVAEAGTIEDDHPVAPQQEFGNSAGVPVVPAHCVAVDQHNGAALAPVAVVQPHAVHVHEGAPGGCLRSARRAARWLPSASAAKVAAPAMAALVTAERVLGMPKRAMVVLVVCAGRSAAPEATYAALHHETHGPDGPREIGNRHHEPVCTSESDPGISRLLRHHRGKLAIVDDPAALPVIIEKADWPV